jgi:cytidyltransferase-like protein
VNEVLVSGIFDDARSLQIRFLREAALRGPVTLLLWSDELAARVAGERPRFGFAERLYFLQSLRFVTAVEQYDGDPDGLPEARCADRPVWIATTAFGAVAEQPNEAKRSFCAGHGIELRETAAAELAGFPCGASEHTAGAAGRRGQHQVIVTGCYDWLHSGHVRFFEEAAGYGELNVVIGSDANVRLLKGEGHPLFPQEERRFVVGSFRTVARCLVATGSGWLDAEPEIRTLGIDRYVVNTDGDRPEKRRFCAENGLEYIVLQRVPREGLPRRASTDLRGF